MKELLVKRALELLESSGFLFSDCCMVRSCFDILARRDDTILLVKVYVNIEAVTQRSASELGNVAAAMSATPLIIGDHMKNSPLSSDVIYTRYNIHAVNMGAFEEILSRKTPLVYSIRGNYCVRINSDLLSDIRKKADMTQDELASELGVSKQSIHRYESSGRISLEIAEKLKEFLKEDIAVPNQIFTSEIGYLEKEISTFMTDLKRLAVREFRNIGLEASITNAPFDILATDRTSNQRILTIASDDRRGLKRKVEIIKDISLMTGYRRVCISNRASDLDVVVIKPGKLKEIKEAGEFLELLEDS
ncbi:MAG: helix-turn-helix domain-containing protein [Candidatus Altiarchaeota archaeon]|nr:helix-turn-helix domain-containing protein [Candidatus Altiarchaeota archaeon]